MTSSSSLTEILDRFDAWMTVNGKKCKGRSFKTRKAYCSDIRVFARFFEAHSGETFAPELVIARDLRAFESFSNAGYGNVKPVGPATWNRRYNALETFFSFLVGEGLVQFNQFERSGLHERRKQEESPRSLPKSDYARVLRSVEQTVLMAKTDLQKRDALRNRAMFYLMAGGGLRVGELCALTSSHLLLSDRKGAVLVEHGKGDKDGSVALGREARLAVADWLAVNDGALLFDGISERQVQRYCQRISELSGVKFTPHSLRHTAIRSVWVSSGGDAAITKSFARHTNIQQTMRYAMPQQEDIERAVEFI
ncbi:MAG: hypothetical protein CVU43_04645 [Chloroflexi bacterium HGW-Chloroflexi-5]|jgi:integrase|nr:MAG: hypothetical protein CVU43_04645 [Chloroflexi bacterium HGW-Chloroflexi-5]